MRLVGAAVDAEWYTFDDTDVREAHAHGVVGRVPTATRARPGVPDQSRTPRACTRLQICRLLACKSAKAADYKYAAVWLQICRSPIRTGAPRFSTLSSHSL